MLTLEMDLRTLYRGMVWHGVVSMIYVEWCMIDYCHRQHSWAGNGWGYIWG